MANKNDAVSLNSIRSLMIRTNGVIDEPETFKRFQALVRQLDEVERNNQMSLEVYFDAYFDQQPGITAVKKSVLAAYICTNHESLTLNDLGRVERAVGEFVTRSDRFDTKVGANGGIVRLHKPNVIEASAEVINDATAE